MITTDYRGAAAVGGGGEAQLGLIRKRADASLWFVSGRHLWTPRSLDFLVSLVWCEHDANHNMGFNKMDVLREDGREQMGFGMYCDLTYMQVYRHHPGYFHWALQRDEEEGVSGPLADWLEWAKQWQYYHDDESGDESAEWSEESSEESHDESDEESDDESDEESDEESEDEVEVTGCRTREEKDAELRANAIDVEAAAEPRTQMKAKRNGSGVKAPVPQERKRGGALFAASTAASAGEVKRVKRERD